MSWEARKRSKGEKRGRRERQRREKGERWMDGKREGERERERWMNRESGCNEIKTSEL